MDTKNEKYNCKLKTFVYFITIIKAKQLNLLYVLDILKTENIYTSQN